MSCLSIICSFSFLFGKQALSLSMTNVCVHFYTFKKQYGLIYLQNRKAETFLAKQRANGNPFFMMLSTPACHAPFTPADPYKNNFSGLQAPRNGSFNVQPKVQCLHPTWMNVNITLLSDSCSDG